MPEPLNTYEQYVLWVCGYQLGNRWPGSFFRSLTEAALRADTQNRALLRRVYPELIQAVEGWKFGDLASRAGIDTDQA